MKPLLPAIILLFSALVAKAYDLPSSSRAKLAGSLEQNVLHNTFSAPQQSLHALSTDQFSTFSHPAFPGYSARIKRAKDWCDPSVKAYTGYIDIGAKHLFFYFFESRHAPATDPLVMWLTGGPGGSSAIGLLMELGPCRVNEHGNGTILNPYGWNDRANIFFLDQPVNVGFSYAEFGETVSTTPEAAKDINAFMHIFTEAFAQFKGRSFHITGESYGGRYIPVFASEIVDQNKHASERGLTPINLVSVLIGNGYTNVKMMIPSWYDMSCTNASVQPILDISQCVRMKRALPRCEKMLEDSCVTVLDELGCTAAIQFCESELAGPTQWSGRNPYNIHEACTASDDPTIGCYPIMGAIEKYLNQKNIRGILGIDPDFGNYTASSMPVNIAFRAQLDEMYPTQYYVAGLLERGIDVLIYVGTYDWICNWVGNLRWVEAMEWGGQKEYNSKEFIEWTADGHKAGRTKSSRGLTFATVEGAGHMVPYDKPVEALALFNRWTKDRSLV